MRYNVAKLDQELRKANLPIQGCDSTGRVQWHGDPTPAQQQQADAVLASHDSSPTHSQALRDAGFDEMDAAFRLVQIDGPRAPQWARDLVDDYMARLKSTLG